MGRKPKMGIDYFPTDVNMFQDRKIKRLLRSAGGKGFTIYIYLLTCIYREKGYYYEWDKYSAFDISDDLNLSESVVTETVKACCSIGLFNEELFSVKSVLSSESIQSRWQKIVTDANRSETDIEPDLELIEGKMQFSGEEIEFSTEEIPEKSRESTQRKEKESIVKESKVSIYDFSDFWNDYDYKKDRKKCEKKWDSISEKDRELIKEFIPIYKAHTPDINYRKQPYTFLNSEIWNDDWNSYPPKKQGENASTKGITLNGSTRNSIEHAEDLRDRFKDAWQN
ncbi:MAG: DUF4373 domain-containing protein [Balneola sp.]